MVQQSSCLFGGPTCPLRGGYLHGYSTHRFIVDERFALRALLSFLDRRVLAAGRRGRRRRSFRTRRARKPRRFRRREMPADCRFCRVPLPRGISRAESISVDVGVLRCALDRITSLVRLSSAHPLSMLVRAEAECPRPGHCRIAYHALGSVDVGSGTFRGGHRGSS